MTVPGALTGPEQASAIPEQVKYTTGVDPIGIGLLEQERRWPGRGIGKQYRQRRLFAIQKLYHQPLAIGQPTRTQNVAFGCVAEIHEVQFAISKTANPQAC